MFGLGANEIILIVFFLLLKVLFWAAIIYLIVRFVRKKPRGLKKCPFCAEMIQPEAVVCRFCGKDLA